MPKDPYLDQASGLLRNLAGITDADELARAEAAYSRKRIRELGLRPIPGHFDLAHLQAIHRYIAQDLFDWAGELRTVDIGKGQMFCPVQNIASYAKEMFGKLPLLTISAVAAARISFRVWLPSTATSMPFTPSGS